ncbi:MAG: PaaI family thioesterase [Candidatus Marinimicrobia bacterium]|nr:PaaI family thioesterase [Candidatus Neomarinimicrobiota bacterium]
MVIDIRKKLYKPEKFNKEATCFACSPYNKIGLQMEFFEAGDQIVSYWEPDKKYEGFHNVLHGGIQSTLIDEIAAWAVFIKGETAGVTKKISVNYKQPVYISKGLIKLTAKFRQKDTKHATIDVKLYNHQEQLATLGEALYLIYPLKIARKKFNYPGVEAFYQKD